MMVCVGVGSPVISAHAEHRISQILQSLVEVKKNPEAHLEQAVPLSAVVQPALQLHWPLDPHSPLRELHEEGALVMLNARHFPVPDMPSSQSRQPEVQAWQDRPKKPDSQEAPVKPAAHEQVPDDVQIPLLEQAGSQAEDCMSTREREPDTASWEKFGTESQKTTRFLEPTLMAAQILDERASDCALREVEELPTGELRRDENPAEPPDRVLE
ncbi:hypothetical protein GG344DRAFT_83509 [Lentinula edodes]|nr:hypothetical protein GG344DRAFT_83509 [Lentinula edodes]